MHLIFIPFHVNYYLIIWWKISEQLISKVFASCHDGLRSSSKFSFQHPCKRPVRVCLIWRPAEGFPYSWVFALKTALPAAILAKQYLDPLDIQALKASFPTMMASVYLLSPWPLTSTLDHCSHNGYQHPLGCIESWREWLKNPKKQISPDISSTPTLLGV